MDPLQIGTLPRSPTLTELFWDPIMDAYTDFNADISNWDAGNVTSIKMMFYDLSIFNQNISSWNVTKVADMTDLHV